MDVVLVNVHAAQGYVASILFRVGGRPATELVVVTEGNRVVVVRVPELQLALLVAVARGTEDILPLVVRRVDTTSYAVGQTSVHELLVPALVLARAAEPQGCRLHIQPERLAPHSRVTGVEQVHSFADLSGR